ncbi:MAG: hypothetical protein Q4G23_06535 [Clostridia bacterium]|nr:hypothetical protein [Clostridia bacterium]
MYKECILCNTEMNFSGCPNCGRMIFEDDIVFTFDKYQSSAKLYVTTKKISFNQIKYKDIERLEEAEEIRKFSTIITSIFYNIFYIFLIKKRKTSATNLPKEILFDIGAVNKVIYTPEKNIILEIKQENINKFIIYVRDKERREELLDIFRRYNLLKEMAIEE